jgi:N-acetylneuraminic acid mutarotase
MPTPRSQLVAVAVGTKIYAIGGVWSGYRTTVEEYDTENDAWATRGSIPTGRRGLAGATVGSETYAIGGYNGNYLATVEKNVQLLYLHMKN